MAGPVYFDAFRRIIVQPDNITVSADAVDDTLTLAAGPGISLVANAGSDQITIVNTNVSDPGNDIYAKRLIVDGIVIDTNLIQGTDSNADLELDANGSGSIQLRSNLKLSDGTSPEGEWTNFTPTWTASTSNPAIGDGLIEGRYKQVGKTVHVWMSVSMGSTTTFGTGEYKMSLPVAARMIASVVLDLVMYDNGTRHYNSLAHNDYTTGISLNNTSVTLFWDTGVVTESAPFTWANGDYFIISGTYEAS
jgi:hypothetical protein